MKTTLLGHDQVVESIIWVPDVLTQFISTNERNYFNNYFNCITFLAKLNGDIEKLSQQTNLQQKQTIIVSTSRDRTIRFWDVMSSTCICILQGHDNWVRGVQIHPNGKFLISVSDDKTMRVWSIEQKRCIKILQAHSHFVTSLGLFFLNAYLK